MIYKYCTAYEQFPSQRFELQKKSVPASVIAKEDKAPPWISSKKEVTLFLLLPKLRILLLEGIHFRFAELASWEALSNNELG
mmetsp:Transcript_33162/g.69670  ORF Transcript_33162/g.69670 Transcript_33162/m.69670 type:complete len:82 (-) Transcript_33162:90-335(-)